ncbi:hypothetical protein B7C42_07657 [Nocardia cerradoensis]|uniref:Uncharacterized protein n=2 Tax=Nocardia cerradoensis TaxID=85688 RepID=A0A231GUG6_9NOCA|nr:hypothetical protein B7C42_07657 [Nocardia cerradoensis]
MAPLTLRVDDTTREELEALARTKGTNVSELLREQIGQLLGRDVKMRRGDVPASLTMTERLILSQQAKIMAALDPDEAEYHLRRSEVLDEGYAGEYGEVFGSIGPELTRTECQLLWDILDMFRVLGASIDKLSQEDRKVLEEDGHIDMLRFRGFDLADELEGRLLSYTRYLTRTERWEEIIPRLEEIGDKGDAHWRWLPCYRAMLETFQPIFAGRQKNRGYGRDALYLSLDELIEVAEVKLQ